MIFSTRIIEVDWINIFSRFRRFNCLENRIEWYLDVFLRNIKKRRKKFERDVVQVTSHDKLLIFSQLKLAWWVESSRVESTI